MERTSMTMPGNCPVTDCLPPLPWRQGYSTDETNDEAREHAAQKFGVSPENIELERNGGCVLARVKKEQVGH